MTADRNGGPAAAGEGWLPGRLLWICPLVGLMAGAVVLWFFGVTLWTAIAFVFLITCPLVVAWVLANEPRRTPFRRNRP
jgi:Flp pilus assembly protein TadB